MSDRPSIAIACAQAAERESLSDWLSRSGYHPITVSDVSRLDEEVHANAVEALIIDMGLLPRDEDVRNLARRLGNNRPLILLGDPSRLSALTRGDVSVIARPLKQEELLLSVGLALAEGRPVRRYARRPVEPIQATAQGMSVTIREASPGGVGIEVSGPRQAVLPPYFNLRIPDFGVHVLVKRAWIVPVRADLLRCGGSVEGDLNGSTRPWAEFAREAPAPIAPMKRRLSF